ncbi:Ig-like domain-containing protein [Collinsella aerofaciens]|uniref:Ig-like domain-containing protein n=1 Tax=Collinsella aerofaciens TaxID=74426 RepID=UPI001EDE3999|nr:Ig-like domain-containing protein [Collinsella aerofaciens]MCG4806949.1 Ig-like domain-containing protein [Collinsella aerofaciens]MCG4816319.1 Ig-like domain-containing protein [Collinsella aerofaciens]
MNRRHVNAAITAGLALTMTVGSVPPQAFAEMMQGDTTQVVAEQSDATGAAAASADTGQATSQDQSEDKIASFASLNELHVAEGSDATLPQTVTATYESGTTKQENVTWKLNGADAPATLVQLPAGSYEFEGTVDGTTQTVKQRVVVEAVTADPAVVDPAAVNAPDVTETSNESGITVESIDANPILEKYVGADYYGQIQSSSVRVKLSDGTETSAYVDWDEKSQTAFDTATEESEVPITGQITGVSVNNNWITLAEPYKVSGVLKVYVPRSTSNGSWVWTAAGIAPALPSSISVNYSNGQSYTCPVEWNEISADQYQKEGTFVVEGHLKSYPSMLAQCTVAVRSVKSVQTELTCTTLTGEVPSLPYSASVVFDSGATEQIPVSWDSFDASLYSKVGSFTVKGKLNGFDYREVTCTVTVKDPKDVLDLNSLRFERVVGDISPLSTYVYFPFTQSNNTTYTQGYQVNWDNADVSQFQKAGTYTVTGTLVTYNESSAANGLKVTAQVEVKEVASIDALAPVNTPVGVRPTTGGGLPYSVEVAFTDGTKKQCNIAWDPILDTQVASEGSFKLSGSLSYWTNTSSSSSTQVELGDSNRATATISVRALQMPSSTSTSTLIGCQPNMPGSIEATMWNGSRGNFPVQWSTISQDALKNLGQITVSGYFTGSNIPATATVNVCDLEDSNIGKIAYVPGAGLLAPRYTSTLYLSDGSSFYPQYSSGQPYSWDEFPQELLDGKPGEYEITGTITGSLAKIHATAACGEVKGVNNYSDNGVTLGQSYEDWRVIYPGEEVNLDYFYVSGVLQDGTTFDSLGVNWDTYDRCPQKDCTITGTVVGTNIPVKVHVIVTKNWEAQPQTITVLKGSDGTAMLPSYVDLVSSDAAEHPDYSHKYAEVKWNTKGFDWTQGGVVRGTATISFNAGYGMQAVDVPITATVKIASKATSVQGGTIWTVPGTKPMLPEYLEVRYDNDVSSEPQREKVTWDRVAEDAYAKDGSFKVKGKLQGGAEATITVDVCSVTSVSVPERINTASGVFPELPWNVSVATSDGKTHNAQVQWDYVRPSVYTGESGQVTTVSGTLFASGLDGYGDGTNTGLTVQTKIVIQGVEKAIDNGETAVTTKAGTAPAMPSKMAVEMSDGSVSTAAIDWDPIAPEKYERPGTFYATGHVVGFNAAAVMALLDDDGQKVGVDENGNVTAKVTVADKKAKKVALQPEAVVVNTTVGSMLELPDAVSVYFSDGSARDTRGSLGGIEIEKWTDTDGIDLSKPLAKKGTYKLVGKLKDVDNVNAIVYVNVSEAPRTITKLEAKSFSVASGTSKQDLYAQMPKQVVATYSDGSTDLLDIDVWDLSNVTDELLRGTGTVEITGTVKLNGAKVTCNVTVVDQGAQTPDHVEPIDVVEIADNAKVSDLMDKLPSKVTVVMKDGKTKKETPVKWSQVDSLGRAGTEFEVTGLTDNGMTAKVQVKVTAHIVDIDVAEDIVVVRGNKADDVLAKLPATVTAIYSDDTESDVDVKWDTKCLSDKDFAKEGEVTVKGKVAGTDQKAECTITVVKSDAEIPASVEPIAGISVPEGASADAVRDALKGVKATVRMKDGKTTAESEITWTEVPAAAATYGSSVVAKGVTKNGNLPVEVVVTSTTTINKVAEVPQITVERDAKADTVTGQLPKKVTVTYSDGHTDEAAVTWNTDGLDKHLAAVGEYTIEGSVEGAALKATCKLVVETPASEIPVRPATFAPIEVFEASSAADVLKALPKKVSVMMKDDSQEDYDVDWENVPALDWGADDVTVGGKVRGTDLTVSCRVRVKPRPAAKGLVIVDQNGKATTAETVLKVERGKEIDLAAAASNAADGALLRGAVTWTSSDPTIATVENGKVKALKNGTVVITVTMPVDGDATAIATLAEDGATETPVPQQLTASVTVEVVEPAVVQKPTNGKDNGTKPDAKDSSGKKDGKKAAKGSLAETGDNTAVTVAALGGTGLLALIAAAIEKLRHRTE